MEERIAFLGQILDNVHGFIPYTEAERRIMETLLFKRLQSIKQLSVVNWVFPGSEHTRFIHSLGVMHIADKMAQSLGLKISERKMLRLAGLLHDIGHYPLSHVCESPYCKPFALQEVQDDQFCLNNIDEVKSKIEGFSIEPKITLMSKSTGRHHEAIGSLIVQYNQKIRDIIVSECGQGAPGIIADIITGNVERAEIDPLLVQILHSELDADGIDYLMRDATFSGTSFGSFEIEQLIRCLTVGNYRGKRILCVTPKGIAAADQYLINKFFSYSQVVFNKHIVVSEWMAEQVVNWMQKHHAIFPSGTTLEEWVKNPQDDKNYLNFTDNMFWSALEKILSDELSDLVPHYIKVFCGHLLHHEEPAYVKGSECRIVSDDPQKIRDCLKKSDIFERPKFNNKQIAILSSRCMSKQVPYERFLNVIREKNVDSELTESELELGRMMECISVKENDGSTHVLCDDERSLMQKVCDTTFAVVRLYEFPQNG